MSQQQPQPQDATLAQLIADCQQSQQAYQFMKQVIECTWRVACLGNTFEEAAARLIDSHARASDAVDHVNALRSHLTHSLTMLLGTLVLEVKEHSAAPSATTPKKERP